MSRHPYADQPPTMVVSGAFGGVCARRGDDQALWQVLMPEFREAERHFEEGAFERVAAKLFGPGWRSLTRDRIEFVEGGPVEPEVEVVRVVDTETGADVSRVLVHHTDEIGWLIDGVERVE